MSEICFSSWASLAKIAAKEPGLVWLRSNTIWPLHFFLAERVSDHFPMEFDLCWIEFNTTKIQLTACLIFVIGIDFFFGNFTIAFVIIKLGKIMKNTCSRGFSKTNKGCILQFIIIIIIVSRAQRPSARCAMSQPYSQEPAVYHGLARGVQLRLGRGRAGQDRVWPRQANGFENRHSNCDALD